MWSEPATVERIAGEHEAGGTHGGVGGMVAEDTENKGQSQGTFWREHRWAVLLKTMGKTQDSEPLGCSRCWLERLGGGGAAYGMGKTAGKPRLENVAEAAHRLTDAPATFLPQNLGSFRDGR